MDVLAEDPQSRRFKRRAPVLPAVIAAAPSRVVTAAGTILLVPFARIEDVARVVVVANAGVDRWGLIPRFLLFRVDRSFLLACRRRCGLVKLRPTPSRHEAFGLLHRGTFKKGTQLVVGLPPLQS
jgi:hypothetical protein